MNLQWIETMEENFEKRIFFIIIIFLPVLYVFILNEIGGEKKGKTWIFFLGKNLLYTEILIPARENFCLIKN